MLLAPLLCTFHWHIKLSHHAYTSPLHTRADSAYTSRLHLSCALAIRISPLRFRLTSHMQRSFATLSVTSCLNLWFAPPVRNLHWHLMCTSQLCLLYAALSRTSQLGLSKALNFYHLSHAACMCTSHSSLSFAILGCPSQWRLSAALVICTSHLHLICTSPSHLSLAARFCTSHPLDCISDCTSYLHL